MFKKIEIWILYLVVLIFIVLMILFGVLVRQELVGSVKLGQVSKFALFLSEIPMNLKKIYSIAKDPGIESGVGYRFKNKIGFVGEYDKNGRYLLLSRYDGNLSESVVELIRLSDFKIMNRWNPDIEKINEKIDKTRDEYLLLNRDLNENRYKIHSPLLTDDGGLIIHSHGSALVKIDKCSNLLWINDIDHFHHSAEKDIDGNYWIPSRIYPYSIDEVKIGEKYGDFFDDAITKVSIEGDILYQKSVTQMLLDNNLDHLVFSDYIFHGDPIHLNDIEPVNSNGKYWRKGDLFLSLRSQNMIILYRPETNKIIRTITGPFSNQHDVDILSENEISIFNNNIYFYKGKRIDDGRIHFTGQSEIGIVEILIYDFRTQEFRKKFSEEIEQHNVITGVAGLSEIFDDGSLFIEETQAGRLLFFNADGKLVLEYVNKANNGMNYGLGFSKVLQIDEKLKNTLKKLKSKKCIN